MKKFNLNSGQLSLWLKQRLSPESSVFNLSFVLEAVQIIRSLRLEHNLLLPIK
jgi:hypothetical protein